MKDIWRIIVRRLSLALLIVLSSIYFISFVNAGKNTNKRERTISNNRIKVIQSIDDYNSINIPRIASIPNENIYLYGIKPGWTFFENM